MCETSCENRLLIGSSTVFLPFLPQSPASSQERSSFMFHLANISQGSPIFVKVKTHLADTDPLLGRLDPVDASQPTVETAPLRAFAITGKKKKTSLGTSILTTSTQINTRFFLLPLETGFFSDLKTNES